MIIIIITDKAKTEYDFDCCWIRMDEQKKKLKNIRITHLQSQKICWASEKMIWNSLQAIIIKTSLWSSSNTNNCCCFFVCVFDHHHHSEWRMQRKPIRNKHKTHTNLFGCCRTIIKKIFKKKKMENIRKKREK